MTPAAATLARVAALARKDAAEIARHPGAYLPALAMVAGSLVPAFLASLILPSVTGERLAEAEELAAGARAALAALPGLDGLEGDALVQAYLFQQFQLLILLVPVVGAMALAAHAVIGEKQARALEPLLATPLRTGELLAAKAATPLVVSVSLMLVALALYLAGIAAFGEPGVWRALVTTRTAILFLVDGPLLGLASLLIAVIISSRVNDPRAAQQLGVVLVLPITGVFVAQLVTQFVLGPAWLIGAAAGLAILNAALLWVGIRVFDRETILTRWK